MSFIKSIKRVFVFKFWGLRGLRGLWGLWGLCFQDTPIFNLMVTDADIKPDSHVSKEVLYGIVKFYVQVRAFSVEKWRERPFLKINEGMVS